MTRISKGYLSEKISSFRNRIFFIVVDTRYQMTILAVTYAGQKHFIWILRSKFILGVVIESNAILNGYSIALIVSFKGIWLGTRDFSRAFWYTVLKAVDALMVPPHFITSFSITVSGIKWGKFINSLNREKMPKEGTLG